MKIDTEGTYTLTYTATDSCGNSTSEERTVVVASPRTVLYTDGTFIINELPEDRAANVAAHGEATNTYGAWNTRPASYLFADPSDRPWHNQRSSIINAEVGSSIMPTNMGMWFNGCNNLKNADLHNIDTSNTVSMGGLFAFCSSLEQFDLSSFDLSNAEDVSAMFRECTSLKIADLSNFSGSKLKNMDFMFYGCTSLTSIDISNLTTTQNSLSATYAFFNCNALTSVSMLSAQVDTLNASNMFYNCNSIQTLNCSTLNAKVSSMRNIFSGCTHLASINISGFDTSICGDMHEAFRGCSSLTSLDISSFVANASVDVGSMFRGCTSLETIYASSAYDGSIITSGTKAQMFHGMSTKLKGGAGTTWSSSHVDVTYAHIDGGTANPGYFTAKE